MNATVMFSKASDEWATPQDLFEVLHAEFRFNLDAAASQANAKVGRWFGPDQAWPQNDGLSAPWATLRSVVGEPVSVWLNPPYSLCREFVQKAREEADKGCTVVCLLPARTDTRWWHDCIWDQDRHRPQPRVEVRFLKGRLKFGTQTNSAPFPSVVVVFRPTKRNRQGAA